MSRIWNERDQTTASAFDVRPTPLEAPGPGKREPRFGRLTLGTAAAKCAQTKETLVCPDEEWDLNRRPVSNNLRKTREYLFPFM